MSCNKMSFGSKEAAADYIKINKQSLKRHGNKKLIPYRCLHCLTWHLTSGKRLKHQPRTKRFEVI